MRVSVQLSREERESTVCLLTLATLTAADGGRAVNFFLKKSENGRKLAAILFFSELFFGVAAATQKTNENGAARRKR